MSALAPTRRIAVYGPVQRAFHWTMAALIFIGLALGVWAHELPRAGLRENVLVIRKSIGMTVLALAALRVVWRIAAGAPAYAEPLAKLTRAAAHSADGALYGLMIAMPVSGYFLSSAGGHEVPWFGLFSFPNLAPRDKALSQAGGQAHYVFAWAVGVILLLHLAAVVWHSLIRRDTVLTRMWPGFRPRSPDAKS